MNVSSQNLQYLFADSGCNVTLTESGLRLNCREAPSDAIYAGISNRWVALQHTIDRISESDAARRASFYRGLLELNERRLYLAKFALDDDDRVILAAEAPINSNSRQLSGGMVKSLFRYISMYAEPIRSGAAIRNPLSLRGGPADYTPFDEFLLSPESVLSEYVWSVATEGWWPLEKQPRGQCWRMGYKGGLKLFDQAWLKLTGSWVLFEADVLEEPIPKALLADPPFRAAFLRHLLRLNDQLYLVKFGIDEEGRLVLLLELPLEILDFDLFLFALRTLGRYLDSYAPELEILAWPGRNPRIAALMAKVDSAKYPSERLRMEV